MHLNRHALRAIRERSGLSITALAARAGVSQPHLSNLESGRRQASPAMVRRLARALAVPVVALLGAPEPEPDGSGPLTRPTLDADVDPDDPTAGPEVIQADPLPQAGLPRSGSAHPLHRAPVPASPPGDEPHPKGADMSDPQLAPPVPAAAVHPIDPRSARSGPTRGRGRRGLVSAVGVLGGSMPAHANTYYSGNCETTDYEGTRRTFQARGIASVDGATGRYIWNWYDYKYWVDQTSRSAVRATRS